MAKGFWQCARLARKFEADLEWVPQEENSLADELSKLIIPDDWMLQRALFQQLEQRWGRHLADLFVPNANNQSAFSIRGSGVAGRRGLTHLRSTGAKARCGSTAHTGSWVGYG